MSNWEKNMYIVLWFVVGVFIVWACLVMVQDALSAQKYNPRTQEWETCQADSTLMYNNRDGSWSYQPPNAQVEYNPHARTWEWDSGHQGKVRNENSTVGAGLCGANCLSDWK